MILSNLSSFKETLKNYPEDMFFKNGNVDSLRTAILKYLNSDSVYKDKILCTLNRIKEENSWEKAAELTLQLYHNVTN